VDWLAGCGVHLIVLFALRSAPLDSCRHDALRDVEMPELQRRQAEAQAAAEAAEGAAAAAASQEQEAAAAAAEAQAAVAEGAAPLAALARDIAARRAQVETLRATMRVTSAARSVADADADLGRIDAERAQLEAARAAASATVQRARDAVAALRTELHAARGEAMRLGAAAERRAAGEAQIAELAAANDALSSEVVEARRRAAPLEARRRELAAAREAARGAARAAEAALEAALRELQTHDTQLEARERALADYESRGGGAALAAACARLETLARQAGEADAACRAAREALQLKKAEAFDRDEVSRQLNDILSFRRSADQEAALAAEMDAKGAAAAALGDRAALAAEFARLEGEESGLRSEADRASGALGTVREAAGRAAAELGQPQYAGVEAKHRAAQVELRTTEMAAADLDKYHKALERALLSFHTTKMADINAAVKELWQKTYRNSDIDYIAIRADTEGGAARSYNYRVVMACGGAELDMRGRCSAGQKVLACLIIRLALAETFCLHCGILALDEPTTNLDADNAGSLAEALRAVMAARREQANFQLVVITHDEAFARHIGTREHAEHMWRITKDDAQHSTLMREEIMA
jgi:DNA repair protein RAD50